MAPAKQPENPKGLRYLWLLATTGGIPMRSLKIALVVGTILNLINQGDALFGAGSVNWFKMVLTFAMPYAVSTYGAVAVRYTAQSREKVGDKFLD